jgi:hypothetical protein
MEKLKRMMTDWGLTDPNRMVPSYLIVAATYLRAHYPNVRDAVPDNESNKLFAWMIRSQLWRHHTGGPTQQKLDNDCIAARSGDWNRMYDVAREARRNNDVDITHNDVGLPLIGGQGSPADGQFILELIRQLAIRHQARDLDNLQLTPTTRYSKDHIFPQRLIKPDESRDNDPDQENVEAPSEFWDHPLNIMFMSSRCNTSLSATRPADYMLEIQENDRADFLSNQFVPTTVEGFDDFLKLSNFDGAPLLRHLDDNGIIVPTFLNIRGDMIVKSANQMLSELDGE